MNRLIISEINIFPVKSAGGMNPDSALLHWRGFELDRKWMIVDSEGIFLSQRTHPSLALLRVQTGSKEMTLSWPGSPEKVSVPLHCDSARKREVTVWNDRCSAVTAENHVNEWLSSYLQIECMLVRMPDSTRRPVNAEYGKEGDIVSFADGFPVLLLSEASLDDLNSRLMDPLPMNRFRPNLVLAGCKPYEEDSWERIAIGDVILEVVKPCSRCSITTVDQDSANRGDEPLRTLASYRKRVGMVYFGQNCIPRALGKITKGDTVEVLSYNSTEGFGNEGI